jgi:hypothetical protein
LEGKQMAQGKFKLPALPGSERLRARAMNYIDMAMAAANAAFARKLRALANESKFETVRTDTKSTRIERES